MSVPPVIWEPRPDQVAAAAITRFTDDLRARTGLPLVDYEELWEFSTEDLAGFWSAVADYFDVRWHQQPTEVLGDRRCPGRTGSPAAR